MLTLLSSLFYLLIFSLASTVPGPDKPVYSSENLVIEKVADQVYQHTSFLNTQTFGRVACNGMVVVHGGEAVVFDTPTDNAASLELIKWVQDKMGSRIIGVVPTHFHEDCVGGLEVFHEQGVPSYANQLTIGLAKKEGSPLPRNGFDRKLELSIGNNKVVAEFVGEGHTRDNVVGYFPAGQVLFGGCLIKEMGATKGNLADANTKEWSATVTRLKQKYPDARVVIPGHGKAGGTELLDYTIGLFRQE